MEAKMINFSKEDRFVIAEFVFSNETDILILSDCIKLVEVLAKHNLIEGKDEWIDNINNKAPGIVDAITKIVGEKISAAQGKEIMNEYYKGA